jgi:hypothetical protein
MRPLFFAHSGVRFLVLLAGVVALVYLVYAALARKPEGKGGRVVMSAFVGFLDLQVLLGVVLGILLVARGDFYPALIGHVMTMVIAAVVAHGSAAYAKRPGVVKADQIRLAGVVVTLVLIAVGIHAIGRAVLGMGSPSFG